MRINVLFLIAFLQLPLTIIGQPIKAVTYKDGRFDIVGTTVKISNCYPALDNQSIKPLRIKISEVNNTKTIQYHLLEGILTLNLSYSEDALVVNTILSGKKIVPGIISILNRAEVTGAGNVYRTPVIISGNGGVKDWPKKDTKYSECHGITGLLPYDTGHTMVISTRDYKKYVSYTYLHPTELNDGKRRIDLSIKTENVAYSNIPAFYFTENRSPYHGMRNEAKASAQFMGVKNDKRQSYHWCSWYFSFYHLTEGMVSDYLKGFKSVAPPVNIQTFQIDAGYHPHVGDWLEPSLKFPNGLEPSVKEIITSNRKAGIWIGPYMVGNRSKLYLEHPDWLLRRNDGSPITQMKFYGEERLWGSIDEEYYVLDTSNPKVMDYLRNVFRTFRKMGFTFYKTDFMYYGWESSNNVKRHTPGKTSYEYQRDLFEMIREEIGPESYWLGCIAPFPVMLGYVDGMRVSGDIGPNWHGWINMFDETKGDQHINNVWWQNDPDALILRRQFTNLSDEEVKSIGLWVGMTGGVINTSDVFHEIPKERLDLFRFLEPGTIKLTSHIPFIGKESELEILVREYPSKKSWAVLFVNRKDESVSKTFSLESLIGVNNATCFDWDISKFEKIEGSKSLEVQLLPHHSKLIFISTEGKSPEGINLSGEQ